MLSHLADLMAGPRCQSQSAPVRGLKTAKNHPKGLLRGPSLGDSSQGGIRPQGAGGAMQVPHSGSLGPALGADEAAQGQHIPQPLLTQYLKVCT